MQEDKNRILSLEKENGELKSNKSQLELQIIALDQQVLEKDREISVLKKSNQKLVCQLNQLSSQWEQ